MNPSAALRHQLINDRRLQILLLLIAVLLLNFWLGSRYPSLDAKSIMAGSAPLADGLSFDAAKAHKAGESTWQNITTTYINWLATNKQGMLFGLAFALLFSAILHLIKQPLTQLIQGRFTAALTGTVIGAPLGVCVNCAAPIGYSMYQQGSRLETALATMISSPTLNLVVLSMTFTLFPFYVVAIKLIATAFILLLAIPLIARKFANETWSDNQFTPPTDTNSCDYTPHSIESSWLAAIQWLGKHLLQQGLRLLVQIVPLMLVAGLIGSAIVVLVPWEQVTPLLPATNTLLTMLLALLALSLFGLLLPVPIAFDVILAATLVSAGMPLAYAAVLLFVLGSFSIYSFMVLMRAKAYKAGLSLSLVLVITGAVVGLATKWIDDVYAQQVSAPLFEELANDNQQPMSMNPKTHSHQLPTYASLNKAANLNQLGDAASKRHSPLANLPAPKAPTIKPLQWETLPQHSQIQRTPFLKKSSAAQHLQIMDIHQLGLHHHFKPLLYLLLEPYASTNGISAGDVNRDGWPDLLLATASGAYLYLNNGGSFQYFARFQGPGQLANLIGASALVDLNNDGWLDIVFSEYGSGLWVSQNLGNGFRKPVLLPKSQQQFAKSLAFQDLNHDGHLEMLTGNADDFIEKRPSSELARNRIYMLQDNRYLPLAIKGEVYGTTLSAWLGDVTGDNNIDMIIANDFDEPNFYYTFDAQKSLFNNMPSKTFTQSTHWAMSLDVADLNNDLTMEIFEAQITFNPSNGKTFVPQGRAVVAEQCKTIDSHFCKLSQALETARQAQLTKDPAICDKLETQFRLDCIANVFYWQQLIKLGESLDKEQALEDAKPLQNKYPELYHNFAQISQVDRLTPLQSEQRFGRYTAQNKEHNLLLFKNPQGQFVDNAKEWGLAISGWTWNARFADINNDGWQDIYIANGHTTFNLETSNQLFMNHQGQGFVDITEQAGLTDFAPTLSYTYIDMDNDGDLDIISFGQQGRLNVIRNNINSFNSVQVELEDHQGNRYSIGAKITLHYGDKQAQIREIKLGGGYMSFDPAIAHFGLGQSSSVSRMDIRWPNGEQQSFKGPFNAGYRYRIIREVIETGH